MHVELQIRCNRALGEARSQCRLTQEEIVNFERCREVVLPDDAAECEHNTSVSAGGECRVAPDQIHCAQGLAETCLRGGGAADPADRCPPGIEPSLFSVFEDIRTFRRANEGRLPSQRPA